MSSTPTEDRLDELLLRWDELRRQGRELPAEELCTDCTELAAELRRRIAMVQGLEPVLNLEPTRLLPTPEDGAPGGRPARRGIADRLSAPAAYRPQRHHARGGLGEVFTARQEELDRVVALKRIRPDKLHEAARRRFLREAAITAKLQHPGIVPIYGLGQDDDGPFYTMPFIQGQTVQEAIAEFHADDTLRRDPGRRSLRLRGLLQQFITACNTVAYAHDQGIVHRDLKPSNIMLGPYGETLVMDWGLAKPFGADDAAAEPDGDSPSSSPAPEALTATGAVLGTPRYMSPEQAQGQPVGPASDVFSLGLVLYAILTGQSAFEESSFRGIDPLKAVREAAIVPPRRRDPSLPRGLEAICLKTLAARPEDRYGSARAVAEDAGRWMADEPVSAWREPASMRTRRWIRRHRTLVSSTATLVLVGLVGLAGLVTALAGKNRELDRQRQAAVDDRNRALKAEGAARDGEAKAKNSEAETKAVLEFFQKKVLAAARPKDQEGGLGRDVTLRAAIEAAEPGIEQSFAGQPTVEASIRATLGESFFYLGTPKKAIRQFERELGLLRQALGPDDQNTLTAMNDLAMAYWTAGRLAEAQSLNEETLKRQKARLGPEHYDTLRAMNNLALTYWTAGRLAEALQLFEEVLKVCESRLGSDHPDTLRTMDNLGRVYLHAGRLSEALSLLEEALRWRRDKLGPGHPEMALSMNNLAEAYRYAGRLADAVPLFEEALRCRRAKLGPGHPETLASMTNLGLVYHESGRRDDALTLLKGALESYMAQFGPDHVPTLSAMNNLALAYQDSGRLTDALSLLEEALQRRRDKLGDEHPDTLNSMANLARAYLLSKPAEAEPLARECLAIREKTVTDDWRTFETGSLLGGSLLGQRRFAEAEPFLINGYQGMKAREAKMPAPSTKNLTEAGARIVQLYDAWGRKDKAEEWRRKLGETRLDRGFPADPFSP